MTEIFLKPLKNISDLICGMFDAWDVVTLRGSSGKADMADAVFLVRVVVTCRLVSVMTWR